MNGEKLAERLGYHIDKGDYHDNEYGEYHPSHISGCPLGAFLDFMTEKETEYNNYMFSGTAVHYYLQESGMLTNALHDAGYHALDTKYEVPKKYDIGGGAHVLGRCDALTSDGDNKVIIDIKYSSIKPEYSGGGNTTGRLLKYATQANTYAHIFGADEWCLLMIYSRADNIPDEISTISQEYDNENWEMVKSKAHSIHDALTHFGYDSGTRWEKEWLRRQDTDFWEEVMQFFDEDNVPAYSGELKYTDRDEWVMPYRDDWGGGGGLTGFKGGV